MSELCLFRVGFRVLPMGGRRSTPRVPKEVSKGVSGGVSDGFPWVSGGFLNDFKQDLLTINYVFVLSFARPSMSRQGFLTHPSGPIIILEGPKSSVRVSAWGRGRCQVWSPCVL